MRQRRTGCRKKTAKRRVGAAVVKGVVAIALVCGFTASGYYVWHDYQEKASAEAEHLTIVREVVTEPDPSDNTEGIDEALLRRVDFDSLKATNDEVSCWLYVPGTGIDGVVMQESTVGWYQYNLYSMYKRYNGCGEFLIPAYRADVEDARLMILGHRMNNYNGEWMFSQLPNRWGDVEGAQEYPYVYVYDGEKATRYRVWAALDAWASDEVYDMPYEIGSDDYAALLEHVADNARYQIGAAPTRDENTLMLSTCNRNNGGALMRFSLWCVPDVAYYYDTETLVDVSDQVGHDAWRKANDEAADAAIADAKRAAEAAAAGAQATSSGTAIAADTRAAESVDGTDDASSDSQ